MKIQSITNGDNSSLSIKKSSSKDVIEIKYKLLSEYTTQNGTFVISNGSVLPKISNGYLSNGHLSNGHLSNGHLSNGHLSNGHLSNGHLSNGNLSNGHISNKEENPENDNFCCKLNSPKCFLLFVSLACLIQVSVNLAVLDKFL